jgi:UDP:flavonoid glycosyltransferase YjiC (YdhE family)
MLWMLGDQPLWGARVKQLKVGTARRFSSTTRQALVAGLRTVRAPHYVARAREIATRMTNPPRALRQPLIL